MIYDLGFKPATYPYAPAADARRLPAEAAALGEVLAAETPNAIAAAYAALDRGAIHAQARFQRLIDWEVRSTLLATVIGAALLSPLGDWVLGIAKPAALAVQYAALAVSIWLGIGSARLNALDVWRQARVQAELKRTDLFRALLENQGPAPLPWQLAYFTTGLLDDQRDYFTKKINDHKAFLAENARWRWVAHGALLAIAALTVASFVLAAKGQGLPVPDWLTAGAKAVWPSDQARLLLALGVVVAMVQNIATLRGQLSLAQRNVERFAIMSTRLTRLKSDALGPAQAAAARGDHAGVIAFAQRVMADLDDEASAWAQVRANVKPEQKRWGRG